MKTTYKKMFILYMFFIRVINKNYLKFILSQVYINKSVR